MSVIVALCDPRSGGTWIGSDTLVWSGEIKQEFGPKWFVREPWAMGAVGHVRTANVVERQAGDLLRDLADAFEFARRVREALRSDGFHDQEDSRGPAEFGQTLMLASAAGVWTIGSDFSVISVPRGRPWAEGSGRELALGAAHALLSLPEPPSAEAVVRAAIGAAIAYDGACGGQPWLARLVAPSGRSASA
ncbi:MAG: hypothetical protein HY521_03300 [Proteobacteria bacterium]|nr:hypothetical protein [Pseudomonadota bacterium]